MKRLAIALSIILLLAMLSSGFSILAQPAHIPHEDPAAAKGSPEPASLLLFYGNVFDLAAISQYQDAQTLLNELEYANIPDELRYLIDRYNSLSQRLFTTLDNLELLLDEASTLLAHYQISEAKQKLDAAEAAIDDAQLLLKDVEAATNTLGDKLGVFAALADSQIRLAYDRLEEMLHRLRQLINELNQLRQSLAQRYKIQAQVELIPTELSLSISPASVFVGDSITAWGRLTGDRSSLAKRKLTLLLDNEPLVVTTDLDGSYATNIAIPYKYVSTMSLIAVYTPSSNDIGTYLGCASSPVVVTTSFYPTLLEVSAPETGHPGLPIIISGQVSSTDSTIDRTIRVLLDDTQLAQEIIKGQFSLQMTPPPQISTGEHSLTVVATPQGRYSGASRSLTINISRIPIQIDIQVPLLIVIPKPIQISGKVYHNLDPVQDARVSFAFRDSSTTVKTATDGSFTATIRLPRVSVPASVSVNPFFATTTTVELPLDLSLIGPQELAITIEPVEPWYASLQTKRWVFTINPANIGLMLVAFISLGLLVFNRVRIRPVRWREEMVIAEAKPQEPSTVVPPSRPKYEFTGIKGRILSAYLNGLETVEKVTTIPMAPHITLREFLNATISRLPAATKPFTELTTIAEIALYSAHRLDEDTAAGAEQLAAIIKEELHSGTA